MAPKWTNWARCAGSKIIGRLTDVVEGGLDSAISSVCARELHCAGSVRGARRLGGMARGKVLRAAHKTGTTNYFKCTAQHSTAQHSTPSNASNLYPPPLITCWCTHATRASKWAVGGGGEGQWYTLDKVTVPTAKKFNLRTVQTVIFQNRFFFRFQKKPLKTDFYQKPLKTDF